MSGSVGRREGTPAVDRQLGRWRRAAEWCGVALTFVALAFVGYQALTADWSHLAGHGGLTFVVALTGASVLYGTAGLFLAFAWWRLLTVSTLRPPPGPVFSAYATTQVYKYFPTNIFHLIGRHAAHKSIGTPHSALLSAAGLEIAGILLTATAIAAATGWHVLAASDVVSKYVGELPASRLMLLPAIGVAAVLSVVAYRNRRLALGHVRSLAVAVPVYAAFFLVSGLIMLLLSRLALGLDEIRLQELLAITTAAWVLGFVVPGAPGGFGVREAVMIVLLEPIIGQANAISLALLYRVATTVGDGLFAMVGLAL